MILADILTFSGRMHPLVVHLPIGFLLLAMIFDGVSYFKKYEQLNSAVPFALLLGFISAAVACILGYMLSLSGDYDYQTLSHHKNAGILLTVLAGILYGITTVPSGKIISIPRSLFSGMAAVALFLMIYAGHQGAQLTHGDNYISMETLLHKKRIKPTQVSEAMIFEDVVQPILEERCIQCHQERKRKGGLSMLTLASMLKGGKHGPAVVPGNLKESELFRRISLDPSHEDYMPADGKTPLTKTEKEIIRWWIDKGAAVDNKKISELEHHNEIEGLAASVLGLGGTSLEEVSSLADQKINENIPQTVDLKLVENLRAKGLVVRVMLQKPVMLDVTLPANSGIKMDAIKNDLGSVAKNIIWLNLSDNGFTENDLEILKQMSNVEKLRLEKNPISDGICKSLEGLKYLEAVNLNETKITAACVSTLHQSGIRRIYTWKTLSDSSN